MGTDNTDNIDDIRKELTELRKGLADIGKVQSEQRFDIKLCVNYMRELALIIGARARLEAIDRALADEERRDTDLAPNDVETKS